MRQVIIIANLFHASPRIPGLTTYLPEFGWQATIITPPPTAELDPQSGSPRQFRERVKLLLAPYRGDILWPWRKLLQAFGFKKGRGMTEEIKRKLGISAEKSVLERALYLYQAIFGYPDTEKTWLRPALRAARAALQKETFDVILSSSPYPTSHFVAKKLKEEFSIPWVADFRDPWSQNHAYPYPGWRKKIDEKLERKTLLTADEMVAASPGYAAKQAAFHKRQVEVITNGFDPERVNDPPTPLTNKLTITYTGTIYARKQDPAKLFAALQALITKNKMPPHDIEVRIYGRRQTWVDAEAKRYGLEAVASQYGAVPMNEALARQRESQVLWLLGWEDSKENGVYPAKIFEYLAARRPILLTGGAVSEDIKKIISDTRAGINAVTKEEIVNALASLYDEYKKNGAVSYHAELKKIDAYSYREAAKKFAAIFEKVGERGL